MTPLPQSGWYSLPLLSLLLATLACATAEGPPETRHAAELTWPAGDPRVRLERVLESDGLRGGRTAGFFRRLAGRARQPGLTRPYAVAWEGDDLLITDPGAGRVLRINPSGRLEGRTEGTFSSPVGVTACTGGIVVSDSETGEVWLLDRSLDRRRLLVRDLQRPTGVACGGGRLFVVETGRHRVLGFDLAADSPTAGGGSVSPDLTVGGRGDDPGAFNYPTTLAWSAGSLWIGDTLNFRLQQVDGMTGAAQTTFGTLGDAPGEMPRIKGIAVDRDGHLWVSDGHLDRVSLFTRDGIFLMDLGGPGTEPGRFSFPTGIAAHPDGRVAVVDSLNRRIQVFRLLSPAGGA